MKKPVIENSDNVIRFMDRIPADDHDRIIGRALGGWMKRNHYAQIESKRKPQSEQQESCLRPQPSLSECGELGIPIDGDVVINLGSRRDSK